ncbi:MAG: hypothetical protein L0227_10140, partial [Chloroflexi bacterium]|nr:hypothetical protein [Chloroflexota bacterium]
IGPRRASAPARLAALVEAWLADPELRVVLGHNAWQGAEFVDRDAWEALTSTTAELAAIADPSASARDAAAAIERRLVSVGRDAGYRVDAIRAALGPTARRRPASGPRPRERR